MCNRLDTLPVNDGFRMPSENQPHDQIWMAWPERSDNWRLGGRPAQAAFVAVAKAIAKTTNVTMAVSRQQYKNARMLLPDHIRVVEMRTDDAWMRDIGPCYVVNDQGERRGIDWHFNAWGGLVDGLYFPWSNDDAVAYKICEMAADKSYRAPIVLEGGAIHVDGEGTLYTTEECLLHPSRNPQLSREQIAQVLADYLNIEKVIWLPHGLFNDETNGHIDNLVHVIKPGEIVLTWCDDKNDPQHEICSQALRYLASQVDAKGRQIIVHKLPMPGPLFITEAEASTIDACDGMHRTAGERLAASYTNYLVTNRQIVYPLLDDDLDAEIASLLGEFYPGYTITGVPGREILLGGGNIHCITQQVPRV